jgi:Flp pilus assembly protein TadG/uncharacterized protein YegL
MPRGRPAHPVFGDRQKGLAMAQHIASCLRTIKFLPSISGKGHRGNILVLTCVLLVVLLAMVAFGVDVGYMANCRTEIQRATDSAALAGAGELVLGTTPARAEALSYLGLNTVGGRTLSATNATIEFGMWNSTTRAFTLGGTIPNAIRVSTTDTAQPLFFGRVLGVNQFDAKASAIATYQPRDIALALDYSGSMCWDSQFLSIGSIGQPAVEANLLQIYQQLGSPTFGNMQWNPQLMGTSATPNTNIKNTFGMNTVAWPLPRGSWDEYIDYVKTDGYVYAAGYRYKYGLKTMLNYVLANLYTYADCPLLGPTSEQPLKAVKDSVGVFLTFLQQNTTDDRVALSIFTYSDNTAILEKPLTSQYSQVSTIVNARQAGHYVGGTNISAGMNKARLELQNNARVGAAKLLILMTDGMPTLPTGNLTADKQLVINEANACAAAKIPVVAISLGAAADTDLLQQVSDITGGAHFIIPGGQTVTQVQAQLEQVFAQVAADRPLKLVK